MPVRDFDAVQLCPERGSGALEMMEEEYNEQRIGRNDDPAGDEG